MRILSVITIVLFDAVGLAQAQGPGLPPPLASWVAPRLAHVSASTTLVIPAAISGDSAAPRSTYWLEGGIIGGVLVGALATQLCKLGDEGSHGTCYVELFFVGGGLIGFPVGGLIGKQLPKHRAAT